MSAFWIKYLENLINFKLIENLSKFYNPRVYFRGKGSCFAQSKDIPSVKYSFLVSKLFKVKKRICFIGLCVPAREPSQGKLLILINIKKKNQKN